MAKKLPKPLPGMNVTITPAYVSALHREIDLENFRAELREAVQATQPDYAGPTTAKKPKARSTRVKQTQQEIDRQRFQPIIKQAAKDAGRNNRLFCEYLDRDTVPVPPTWKVADWKAAWNKKLYTKISAFKSDRT